MTVKVVADVKGLLRPMKLATSAVAKFGKAALSVAKSWQSLVAIVSGGAFAFSIRRTIEDLDRLAKTASTLGFSVESMAAFELAASESGVAVEQLTVGLSDMVAKIQEASRGTGEAAPFIERLGLDAQRLAQLRPERQFRAIADAMQDIRSSSQRLEIGRRLFGEGGRPLLKMMELGSKGLDDMVAKAERLGLVIGPEMAAKIERANDAINRIGLAFKGLWRQISVNLAPVIEAIAGKIEGVLTAEGRIADWGSKIADAIIEAVKWVIDAAQIVTTAVIKGVANLIDTSAAAINFFAELARRMGADKAGGLLAGKAGSLTEVAEKVAGFADNFDPEKVGLASVGVDRVVAMIGNEVAAQVAKEQPAWVRSIGLPDIVGTLQGLLNAAGGIGNSVAAALGSAQTFAGASAVRSMPELAAVRADSAEAYRAILRHQRGIGASIPKEQLKETKKQTKIAEKTQEVIGDVANELSKLMVFTIS